MSASLDLILIPTARELGLCEQDLLRWLDADRARMAICGWGVVAAGLRTMQLLAEVRPRQVWLLGSAGAYSSALPVGQAFEFSHIALHGLGVGAGANWLSPVALGWQESFGAIGLTPQTLPLAAPPESRRQLLSVCAASASAEEAREKQLHFPEALAEDMEAYAVAAACRLHGVPLRVVRGISNLAGDRDHQRWRMDAALRAAVELAGRLGQWREPGKD